jgi:hypothetical protein
MQIRSFLLRAAVSSSLLAVSAGVSTGAGAQASTHVGMRVGYNFETDEALLSANLTVPMTSRIYFYPSLDIYTPDRGNRIGFNGDMKISFPMASGPAWYAGAGVGVVNRNEGDFSNTDVGANLLAGLESRTGWIHPFVEGKVLLYNRSQFQLIAGVNLTLGPRY